MFCVRFGGAVPRGSCKKKIGREDREIASVPASHKLYEGAVYRWAGGDIYLSGGERRGTSEEKGGGEEWVPGVRERFAA